MSEWANEWMCEYANEWMCEYANVRIGECAHELRWGGAGRG